MRNTRRRIGRAAAAAHLAACLLVAGNSDAQVFWDAADFMEHCAGVAQAVGPEGKSSDEERENATYCLAYVMGAYDTLVTTGKVYSKLSGKNVRLFCPTRETTPQHMCDLVLAYMEQNRTLVATVPAAQSLMIALVEAFPCPR